MKQFLNRLQEKARSKPQKIVFPEGEDPRVLKAVSILQKTKICLPIVLGNPEKLAALAKKNHIYLQWDQLHIVNPENSIWNKKFAALLYKLRREKGLTPEAAANVIKKVNYFGTIMVYLGYADGLVSGTTWSTAETVRPALQIIKTKKRFHKVSGYFFMMLKKRLLLFADCAISIEPNSYELADIAIDTAKTAHRFGIKPKIAMLSFSTNHSANHPNVDKVREATEIARYRHPKLIIEGEMQVDAALVPEICQRKFPNSRIQGDANVLIFPNLEAANISYKLVERLGGFTALGPILQGLKKPVNDLSRGCSFQDIVSVAAITAVTAQIKN